MKRLGVLGTLVWDRIWRHDLLAAGGEPLEEWGGIAYALGAVAAARPVGWEVVPLIKVGADLAGRAAEFLRSVPELRIEPGVRVVPDPNHRVELRYHDAVRRCEQLTGGVPPWRWEELEPLVVDLDALYLNFISGFELELADVERLRAGFAGPIYADVHSLLLGRAADGRRIPRPLPEWQRWIRCFDAIQLNEDELATLASGWGDPWHFAAGALHADTLLIVVTLGGEGAVYVAESGLPPDPLAWPAHRAVAVRSPTPVCSAHVPVGGGPVSGDPTGCGDVWGSTLFAHLLGGCSLEEALRRAHAAAARNVRHSGASGLCAHLRGELHRG
jgi:hypothetical protein